MDQSAVSRFEHAKGWPRGKDGRGPDQLIAAYADDLDLHPIELWEAALAMWRASLSQSQGDPAEDFASAVEEAGRPPHERNERSDTPEQPEDGQEEAQ